MEFLGVYGLDTIVIIAFAIIYYKAAQIENASTILWTGLSIIVSLVIRIIGMGLLAIIIGQVLLYLAITLVRLLASKRG
jgi:predicted branched-subunit amino acid permease